MNLSDFVDSVVCPRTLQTLELISLKAAEQIMGGPLVPCQRTSTVAPIGPTGKVLVREDRLVAYPVVDDIPVLLIPESLVTESNLFEVNLDDRRYKEAFAEADFYSNEVALAENVEIFNQQKFKFQSQMELPNSVKTSFPEPKEVWIDAVYDCIAQHEAYSFLSPIIGNLVYQIGGKGLSALTFLAVGASSARLVTPIFAEAQYASRIASALGLDSRFQCIVGLAEELPLRSGSIEKIYIGGSLHHMQPDLAADQFQRVLTVGGRFAAVEPWRAPFYDLGTGILGKREANSFCYPLTESFMEAFESEMPSVNVQHHGALSRYLALAGSKIGRNLSIKGSWRLQSTDDRISKRLPNLQRQGSSVAILAEKM